MNDIVINKIQSIQRCIRRAREEYQADLRIVKAVIVSELDELLAFADRIREYVHGPA